MPGRERVLSGMRPSGSLHLGNYLGALANWVRLQDDYECFYFSADWHVLTDDLITGDVPQNTIDMAVEWLGAGLDPERSTLFIQSLVPEHAELHLLFSMVTPVGWLERVPTYKERIEQQGIASPSYGLLGYPLLQSADILMYKTKWVPVGIDQAPHVELTREVARRFNNAFGPVFPEPDVKLTEIPKVPGTDGRKMSKSYGNAIQLSDPSDVISQKIRPMVTDPARKRRSDPGNPDICPVFDLHKIFTPDAERQTVATQLPHGRVRLPRLQGRPAQAHAAAAGEDPGAAPGLRREARRREGRPDRGLAPGAGRRASRPWTRSGTP